MTKPYYIAAPNNLPRPGTLWTNRRTGKTGTVHGIEHYVPPGTWTIEVVDPISFWSLDEFHRHWAPSENGAKATKHTYDPGEDEE